MKLRQRLLSIAICALLVPVLIAIAVAAAVAVGSSGRAQEARFRYALEQIRQDISDTERRYRTRIAEIAMSPTLQEKLYVYSTYWGYFSKDDLDPDIEILRDELEGKLLGDAIDTIAVYRREGTAYSSIIAVGNSTYLRNSIQREAADAQGGQPEYAQTADGFFATFYMPVYRDGSEIGLLALQKAFDRSYLEALSYRFNIGIALYAQGLYRYISPSLPEIEKAGALWTRSRPMTGGPFSGSYRLLGKVYKFVGSYFEMGSAVKGFLFVGGPSTITVEDWRRNFLSLSVVPLICAAVATVLFFMWGSEVITAIRRLLGASEAIGRGEYEVRLPVERKDEFGVLYRGFSRMAEQLKENAARLEENKRMLVTSEKMAALGRFSAGIAHEINNPLGIILNHVQLLRTGKLDEVEQGEFLARIEAEIKRTSRLLRNILHHATEEELAFCDLSLESVVAEVVELFAPKLRLKGVRIEVGPFPTGAIVEGDADAIKQVFFNLIYNALQAIHHDQGLVRIGAEDGEAGYKVLVADNGEGMDEATRSTIFEPFVTRKKGYGTGLGLALSRTIMKQHGGDIEASGEPNVGSVITLWFPRKEAPC
jgi:signal transduction histidine kinase